MRISKMSCFGTDLGDVVIDRPKANGVPVHKPTTEQFVEAPPVKGAFDAISRIIDHITPERFSVISKVKSDLETRLWLGHHDFYGKTGFVPQNLYFCRERHEKGSLSDAMPNGPLDYFVDDRADVLSFMPNVARRYLFGPQRLVWLMRTDGFVCAPTWQFILDDLFVP